MKVSRKGLLAIALTALVAIPLAHAAGMFSLFPIVGSPATCAATVSGAGGFNAGGFVGGGGATGQGQAASGALCAQTIPAGPPFLTGAELVPADTAIGSNGNPQTVRIPVTAFGNYGGTPRNYLDNGALNIAQRGTGTVTCGTNTAPTSTAYSADRWVCDVNVASGAGRTAVITSTPSPPAGFVNSVSVFRTSGALTQPVCAMQEIGTKESTALAGQTVTYSFYADALAGLVADNGGVINAVIISGTGTDQGFGTLTASPAITPAWTGITTVLNQAIPITTTYTRYAVTANIPSTATEVGVMLCFTPTATGAGATDGFAFTGAQLEIGAAASPFEFHTVAADLAKAQSTYYRYAELAAAYQVAGICEATGATTNSCTLNLPQQMRAIPTITITTAGTFKVNIAGTLTTIASPTAGACGLNTCLVTAANTNTAGQVELLSGAAGGTGVWEVSADY